MPNPRNSSGSRRRSSPANGSGLRLRRMRSGKGDRIRRRELKLLRRGPEGSFPAVGSEVDIKMHFNVFKNSTIYK